MVGLGSLQQSPEADPADKDGVRRRGAREDSVSVSGLTVLGCKGEMGEGRAQL